MFAGGRRPTVEPAAHAARAAAMRLRGACEAPSLQHSTHRCLTCSKHCCNVHQQYQTKTTNHLNAVGSCRLQCRQASMAVLPLGHSRPSACAAGQCQKLGAQQPSQAVCAPLPRNNPCLLAFPCTDATPRRRLASCLPPSTLASLQARRALQKAVRRLDMYSGSIQVRGLRRPWHYKQEAFVLGSKQEGCPAGPGAGTRAVLHRGVYVRGILENNCRWPPSERIRCMRQPEAALQPLHRKQRRARSR